MKLKIIFICCFYMITALASAQDDGKEIGGYLHYQRLTHDVDFGTLPGVPGCCPNYEDGSGNGFSFGGIYIYPLTKVIALQGRVGYSYIPGQFTKLEYIGNTYDNDMNVVEVYSEHNLKTSLHNLDINPVVSVRAPILPIYLNLGLKAQILTLTSYDQKEKIASPADAMYLGDLKVRNPSSGSINDVSRLLFSASGALAYKININEKYKIYPEIGYSYGFNDVLKNYGWKTNSFFAGAIFTMALDYVKPAPEPEPAPIVEAPPRPILEVNISAETIDGKIDNKDTLIFFEDRFITSSLFPLLPYIFFEDSSYSIPQRYLLINDGNTGAFDINKLFYNSDLLTVYYRLPDIIGSRMKQFRDAEITITGCNSDLGSEKGNLELSRKRAEAIKDYLVNTWDIEAKRIHIKKRNLPAQPTVGVNDDYYSEENQRVEISSNFPEILKPVLVYDTITVRHNPKLLLKPDISSSEAVERWRLQVFHKNDKNTDLIKEFSGKGTPNDSIIVEFPEDIKINSEDFFSFVIEVQTDSMVTGNGNMPASMRYHEHFKKNLEKDKEVSEYWFIMFDFNDISLLNMNKDIMDIICKNSAIQSEVIITGYTDLLGNEKHNQELSEKRAFAVKQGLPCKVKSIHAKGAGEKEVYNNSKPEGRFYNRTVHVRVETPIGK